MNKEFYCGNRQRFYQQMKDNSLLVLFSGTEVRKTNDEFYPFYTNRNFLYLTGLDSRDLALLAQKTATARLRRRSSCCLRTSCRNAGPVHASDPNRPQNFPAYRKPATQENLKMFCTVLPRPETTVTCIWISTALLPQTGMNPHTAC